MTNTLKKFRSYFTMVLAVASVGFLSSCGDDNEDPEPSQNPTIEFIGGSGFTSEDKTVPSNEVITSKINAKANTSTGKNLERFLIQVQFDGGITTTYFDTTGLKGESFEYTNTFPTRGVAGTEKWTYTITDNAGRSSSQSYTITTTSSNTNSAINTFTTQLFGSYQNSNPGFFSTTEGKRYFRNTAVNNQDKIDFVYYYGATNKATLAAPNDPDANTINDLRLSTWTTKNATTFRTTSLNKAAFDAATNNNGIDLAYNSGTATNPASSAKDLKQGDVIAFSTQAGKKGLIYVSAITTGAAGTITVDVKVQK